ncbi:hypothetical protein AMS68_000909 [Peltaster fructicola]|uniref:REM-1 domain-containing protein n=1 Tax=Peltaster fructicola TaxID=286661 RepID=A0A6H0XKX2_9PEZI|nr:hypothetical protein AMS68_000909 [Peltaster fructicola]
MTPIPRPIVGTQSSDGFQTARAAQDVRSIPATSFSTARSVARSNLQAPGSFTAELRSTVSRTDLPRHEYGNFNADEDDASASERKQTEYKDKIDKEMKIKVGTENLLEALNSKKEKHIREQRRIVEQELYTSNRKIAQLKIDLETEIQRSKDQPTSPRGRLSQLFKNAPLRSASSQNRYADEDESAQADEETESPSYVLAEILQALEREEMPSDYYVNHANELVELFKRHPSLKYDLAWSIFGLRMQMLMLSDSREVVAAGYRVMRYAITERKSLQTIRSLQTDCLVILSLVKESKMRVEREQALKFIRAFVDVKEGTKEIHPAIVRVVVAVADHADDQLRNIAILTLAEILLKDPQLVVNTGGMTVLADAMGSGSYSAPETLVTPILNLMDTPAKRGMLHSGFEFSAAFATLTEPHATQTSGERLRASTRVIAAMFKSWPGLMTLSQHDFLPVRSVVSALYICTVPVRETITDLIASILRIHFPSWAETFIGGRRLTTYGRVTNLRSDGAVAAATPKVEDDMRDRNLVEHFTAVALTMLLRQGLLPALMHAEKNTPSVQLGKKTSVLLAEVLRMAGDLLPNTWSASLQTLPGLFASSVNFDDEQRLQAASTVYEVDRINRMLHRSTTSSTSQLKHLDDGGARARASSKSQVESLMDEQQLKLKLNDTGVLSTVNFSGWNWVLIQSLLDGPLQNPRRLAECIASGNKFAHRLLGFMRPFKYRFSDAPNTKLNQRYVRAGCSLIRVLLQTNDGARYLADNKLIPQIAECLAQKDWASGITSQAPLFSPSRMSETLVGGYFAFLGVMCSDVRGLQILERWKILNMFYHIVELKDRDDLIRSLLTQLEYNLDSHPRIILAKAMVSGSKSIRIMATKILRKHALTPMSTSPLISGTAEWAIKLLVSQIYDPEIEVCEVAIKALEEACNNLSSLEYVVKCRPALDHLGEIGAPLLLRFLSTSVGYHYLDGLDYITREMDDWFLGRNDTYVTLVEASLARALTDMSEKTHTSTEDAHEVHNSGFVPPHFYRELTRTAEGCELLKAKGHFEEFAATIEDYAMESVDAETILKVKGCLWAVGNVGSMELGSPFLEQTDVVKHIVAIAEGSEVMSLRGTAFYVLGLISRSLHGQEILAEHGWDGTTNVLGESLGYSLPLNFGKLFLQKTTEATHGSSLSRARSKQGNITDADTLNNEILKSIKKLCNSVLINKAVGELNHLKHNKKAPGFSRPALFRKAMVLLASRTYRIPQYRFVIDLFDKGVLRKIVLEEDSDDDDIDDDDDDGQGQITEILAV